AVEPGTAAEAADHRNLHRRRHCRAGDGTRIGEVEEAGAGRFKKLCLFDEFHRRFGARLRGGGILRAVGNAVFARGLRGEAELRDHRNAGVDECAHDLRIFRSGVDLDQVGAAFANQPLRGGERGVAAVLNRSVGHIAADQRPRGAAPDRLAADQHFLERNVEHVGPAPKIDADGVANRDEIEAGAIGDAHDLIIPGDEADTFLPLPLHLLKVGNCDLALHEPGKDVLGPSLAGIIGRKSGAEPNYGYSPAMKAANLTWAAKTLDAYLDDPQKLAPGNKMPSPGLKPAQDRADVIAFLAAPTGSPAAPTPAAAAQPSSAQAQQNAPAPIAAYVPDARYTLRSGIAEGRMVYIGVGGAIDGKVNPVLTAAEGQVVQLTLINGEGAEHDIVFPDQDAKSPRVTGKGASTTIAFRATKSGDFVYFCSVPGHRQAGMEGQFTVTPRLAPQ